LAIDDGKAVAVTDGIVYAQESSLSAREFRDVLIASTLGERRPVGDTTRLDEMLRKANLVLTARADGKLVGVARALTDFSFCCYLSDLAVDAAFQNRGIGRRLIEETHRAAGPRSSLILISAPAAEAYYPKIAAATGLAPRSAWAIPRKE
jgi:ribosomal protein S18 acetylase RimI-like enzyme